MPEMAGTDMKTKIKKPRNRGIGFSRPIDNILERQGWALVHGEEFRLDRTMKRALTALTRSCRALRPDPKDTNGTRWRRLQRMLLLPWSLQIEPRPDSSYFQTTAQNPIDGGSDRVFAPFTDSLSGNRLLRELIRMDYLLLPTKLRAAWGLKHPLDVGVHVMAYMPRPFSPPAVSTPPSWHKDGEPVTVTHLIERDGVEGGESGIAANDGRVLLETTLGTPLDSIYMIDEQVFHRVGPMSLAGKAQEGIRSVVLIDFTPYRPNR
jgi:hypothetical protein